METDRHSANSSAQLEATKSMLQNHLEWRAKIKPEEVLAAGLAVRSGCWRYLGLGRQGSPVLWCNVGRWNPHEYDIDIYQRLVASNNHIAESVMSQGSTTTIVLFDMKNWAMWHANYLSYISHLCDISQNHYPERLNKIFLVNTPIMFRATWALVKMMLAQKTIDKVVFVTEDVAETLMEYIPAEVLPQSYGGEQPDDEVPCPNFPGVDNVEEYDEAQCKESGLYFK
jgi:hypothetical protein